MTVTDNTIEVLNDLIAINNDRIVGYELAMKELKDEDADLKSLFVKMIDESHKIKMALGNEVQVEGSTIESGTTNLGKIYRAWMSVKATFTGHTKKSILESCAYGEEAAQNAYSNALKEEHVPKYIIDILEEQKAMLQTSLDKITTLKSSLT